MPEGPRRRSPPLTRAERRALIDEGVAIHTTPRRPFTPDEQAAILRAADTLDDRRKVLRAQIEAEERHLAERTLPMRTLMAGLVFLAASGVVGGGVILAIMAMNPWFDGDTATLVLVGIGAACVGLLAAMKMWRMTAPGPEPAAARDDNRGWFVSVLLQSLFFMVAFPPFGGMMMLITIPWRYLSHADIALGLLVPLYGWVRFWTW